MPEVPTVRVVGASGDPITINRSDFDPEIHRLCEGEDRLPGMSAPEPVEEAPQEEPTSPEEPSDGEVEETEEDATAEVEEAPEALEEDLEE